MATSLRHDRIIPLRDLSYYPDSEWLDITLYLPWSIDARRRVWLMIPESSPTISIDDTTLSPRNTPNERPRWVDYGTAELPILSEPNWAQGEFYQLRIRDMKMAECAASYLVITTQLDLSLEGCSLEEAEKKLWGLSSCEAGATMLRPASVTAGSGTNFTVRYTSGGKGLPAGAQIRFTVPALLTMPQIAAPDASGYVSIFDSDGAVSIVTIERSVESHESIDIVCRLTSRLGPFEGFNLHYTTDTMYIYPGKFNESDRRYWYSRLPPLAAAVAISEGSSFVNLEEANGHVFETVPGPSERLHLFLPGRRFTADALSLRGVFTDHYRNIPPSGPINANFELWLVGENDRIPLGTPAGHFTARHRFEVALPRLSPGVYRAIAYRPNTLDEVARSNPLEVINESESRDQVYWGEIHGHTEMSDGSGDFWELYRHAHDEGCLDFAAAIDHAEYISDNQWLWMQDVTNAWNQPGRFVTLIGYEWEGQQRDRCVYTSRSRLDLVRGCYHGTNSLEVVWGHFRGDEEVVGGPHATMVHKTVWEHHDPSVERFAEIYSMWGASDFRDGPLVPAWIEDGRGVTINDLLQSGAKLGFTGGGDCHEGHCGFSSEDPDGQGTTPHSFASILLFRCGMTAALLPNLDRVSLIQAIRNRRTYATTGARILLEFTAASYPMGSVEAANEVECHATVHAVEPVRLLEIIKDGKVAWCGKFNDLDMTINWHDPEPPKGEHYYYLHVVQADGHMAWSSPIWIRPLEKGSDDKLDESEL